jgi:hypothetical protein
MATVETSAKEGKGTIMEDSDLNVQISTNLKEKKEVLKNG